MTADFHVTSPPHGNDAGADAVPFAGSGDQHSQEADLPTRFRRHAEAIERGRAVPFVSGIDTRRRRRNRVRRPPSGVDRRRTTSAGSGARTASARGIAPPRSLRPRAGARAVLPERGGRAISGRSLGCRPQDAESQCRRSEARSSPRRADQRAWSIGCPLRCAAPGWRSATARPSACSRSERAQV